MKIKYALGVIGMVFGMTGCDLDVKMYDGVMAEDLDDKNIEELSQGTYRLLKNDNGLIQNGVYFWSFGADDITWNGTSTGGTWVFYDYSRNKQSVVTEYTWELGYRTIGNCNLVIEKVTNRGDAASAKEKVMMGENYYIRALCYFLLCNEFAQPYSNNPTQNPGVPLKLNTGTADEDMPRNRSTVAEVYAQVVSDLKDAITYMTLPSGMTPKTNIYGSKEAAEALLARVYLYMGNYDDAFTMADNVIKSNRFELEKGSRYITYPQIRPEDNKETIFAVRRTLDKDSNDDGFGNFFIYVDGTGWEEMSPSSRYLDLIELTRDANDMPADLRSRYIVKRFIEDGAKDYSLSGYPDRKYEDWTFVYPQKTNTATYKYVQKRIKKQADGRYAVLRAVEKGEAGYEEGKTTYVVDTDIDFQSGPYLQKENYNLGSRYFIKDKNGNKVIGRVEPMVYDANTKRGKDAQFLVYAVNKFSYQEQSKHLWSPVISRLAEMYLIRAEYYAEKGQIQEALDNVNELRRRAGITEWTLSNMQTAENGQPKDIKKIVEEERMLELAWEGHRRFDIFRKRGTLDRRYPGGHTIKVGDKFIEVRYNDPAVCEFIPQGQYDNYPYELEQNP